MYFEVIVLVECGIVTDRYFTKYACSWFFTLLSVCPRANM